MFYEDNIEARERINNKLNSHMTPRYSGYIQRIYSGYIIEIHNFQSMDEEQVFQTQWKPRTKTIISFNCAQLSKC
jgi:hypothetical protein